jgi:hypothetical protein
MTPKQHQKNIAYKTLRMTPAMAKIMGGMSFEEAYEIIFKTPLKPRLLELIAEYGSVKQNKAFPESSSFCWELGVYGWNSPSELLELL